MAKFNEIQVGRFNRFLQKFLSMKGGPPAPSLGSDLVPMIQLDELNLADTAFLRGWDRYSLNVAFVASAANFNRLRIRNPAGSNVIVMIDSAWFTSGAGTDSASLWYYQPGVAGANTDLGTAIAAKPAWDARQIRQSSAVQSSTQGAQSTNVNISQRTVPGGNTSIAMLDVGIQFPLLPGSSIEMQNNTANVASSCYITWRERFLEDSERLTT